MVYILASNVIVNALKKKQSSFLLMFACQRVCQITIRKIEDTMVMIIFYFIYLNILLGSSVRRLPA